MHNRRGSQSPKQYLYNEDLISSKIVKDLRMAYQHLGLNSDEDVINYLQFVMLLQTLNYINKQKATDEQNQLLVEAWNSLKTRNEGDCNAGREGITFKNLSTFLHIIHNIAVKDIKITA